VIKYRWHEETSESFGLLKRPVAEIHIKDCYDIWRAITMYIDSGADVSIMMRSFGELFGHDVKKGKKIRLKGVGPAHINAYIHKMEMLIGEDTVSVEVAIAEDDMVPNILGRKHIFDLFEITFNNKEQHTSFMKKD
jgi:hypothetical protein